jgi:hypothetical protein
MVIQHCHDAPHRKWVHYHSLSLQDCLDMFTCASPQAGQLFRANWNMFILYTVIEVLSTQIKYQILIHHCFCLCH